MIRISEIVVDTSVVAEWILNPRLNSKLSKLREFAFEQIVIAPALLKFEITNVLVKRARDLGVPDVAFEVDTFSQLPIEFDFVLASHRDISHIALQSGLTGYDAAYLELAMRRNAPIATLDKRLARAATKLGLQNLA